jgi:hypothetical protein
MSLSSIGALIMGVIGIYHTRQWSPPGEIKFIDGSDYPEAPSGKILPDFPEDFDVEKHGIKEVYRFAHPTYTEEELEEIEAKIGRDSELINPEEIKEAVLQQ